MATLIAVYNGEGCVGRCDARCYDAKSVECTCICGGKNHGSGEQLAAENTLEFSGQWLKAKGLLKKLGFRTERPVHQPRLI